MKFVKLYLSKLNVTKAREIFKYKVLLYLFKIIEQQEEYS